MYCFPQLQEALKDPDHDITDKIENQIRLRMNILSNRDKHLDIADWRK